MQCIRSSELSERQNDVTLVFRRYLRMCLLFAVAFSRRSSPPLGQNGASFRLSSTVSILVDNAVIG